MADLKQFHIKKKIYINNFKNVEAYLKCDIREGKKLKSLRLDKNKKVKGVKELLARIPDGYYPNAIQHFYEETGLRLQVEVYNKDCEVTTFDKDGRYPREDAAIWNRDFVEGSSEHPEWYEPQEEADILVRYIFPLIEEKGDTENGSNFDEELPFL